MRTVPEVRIRGRDAIEAESTAYVLSDLPNFDDTVNGENFPKIERECKLVPKWSFKYSREVDIAKRD